MVAITFKSLLIGYYYLLYVCNIVVLTVLVNGNANAKFAVYFSQMKCFVNTSDKSDSLTSNWNLIRSVNLTKETLHLSLPFFFSFMSQSTYHTKYQTQWFCFCFEDI